MKVILSVFIIFAAITGAWADDAKFKGDCIRNGGKLVYSEGWQCVKK